MEIKQALKIIDKCQSVRMAIYLKGETIPAPIDPLKDFGITHDVEGEITKKELAKLISNKNIKKFRGYEL